jgi:uncharacterized sulfatase
VTGNEPPIPRGVRPAERYRTPEFLALVNETNAFITRFPRLPGELGKAGYSSFQAGKWWAGGYATGGFTHGMSHGEQARGGRHGDEGLAIGRRTMQPIHDFIARARAEDRPFFVWYAPMLPHDPHNPPERLLDRYRQLTPSIHVARYWAMCEWFDETCGALLDHLDAQGLSDDTIVALVTDNGRVQDPDSAGALPSKNTAYDAGLRTPIVLRWPVRIAPRMDDTPVSSLDLMPTLLKAAGVAVPAGLPGLDLLDREAVSARPAVFGACFLHNAVDIHEPARNLTWRWCVEGNWKLIVPHAPNIDRPLRPGRRADALELYDLAADPRETRDLAEERPERARELQQRLDGWWRP